MDTLPDLSRSGASDEALSPRSAAKRRQIIEGARRLFLERGFARTSMDAIREAAQVSKPTLYAYYSGKDELFVDVLRGSVGQTLTTLPAAAAPDLTSRDELRQHLLRVATSVVAGTSRDEYIRLVRVAAAEAPRLLQLAASLRDVVGQRAINAVTAALRAGRARQLVREAEPVEDAAAARMFVGYLLSHFVLGGLLSDGSPRPPDEGETEAMVDLFLRAVGPHDV